jgi:hypothetical protein
MLGGGLAGLALIGLVAWLLLRPDTEDSTPTGPGELTVQTGLMDDPKLDPGHPLKCFVNGQAVGVLPLKDCAQRNGVDPGALDVGLDASGALGASNGLTSALTPLPPTDETGPDQGTTGPPAELPGLSGPPQPAPSQASPRVIPAADTPGPCWRYGDGGWSRLPTDTPLGTCVQSLYAGQCEPPGAVAYGRWRGRTLRLVTGRVEMMGDDHVFRLVAPQAPDCSIPSLP